ncbi:hypothetical protein ACFQ51_00160 [Streptomyces kaempferi]
MGREIALDLDMVSASAPGAHILLVETDNDGLENLAAGVDRAVALGAKYVSNSYGLARRLRLRPVHLRRLLRPPRRRRGRGHRRQPVRSLVPLDAALRDRRRRNRAHSRPGHRPRLDGDGLGP